MTPCLPLDPCDSGIRREEGKRVSDELSDAPGVRGWQIPIGDESAMTAEGSQIQRSETRYRGRSARLRVASQLSVICLEVATRSGHTQPPCFLHCPGATRFRPPGWIAVSACDPRDWWRDRPGSREDHVRPALPAPR